ncbi:hypothetical protein BIU82_00200 [Arthrobacter sp. SW1]|uniref:histone-like nucleoid-structuring protein Lsr2 n=1 Tax=Arthrobacter sp. SW1 TaxID=1920889 RepID=UPI000877E415|nr:Lsr2 family protein [Arthrobacter sp. SW1]OFI39538.1 hypothetical protein BIU82_00200 [Arthrobacter sp. SW1]
MAKEVIYRLVDDLTGETIPEGEGETLHFTYNGSNYEIDLSAENATEFHELLGKYAKAGRKIAVAPVRQAPAKKSSDRERLVEIRAWAAANGYSVNSRGRIAQSIVDAYEAAN